MATEIRKWQSENGKMFDTQQEAEQEDFVSEVADVIDRGGNQEWEFNSEAAVRALLKEYRIEKLEQAK
jgi:hypothetical protein